MTSTRDLALAVVVGCKERPTDVLPTCVYCVEVAIMDAEERGRRRGLGEAATAHPGCMCDFCRRALAPRDSAPREVPGPFAKGEDPAKCMHAWECHVYERGKDYCPYCFSMREEVPRDSGKEK